MNNGYMGKVLWIDLGSGKIEFEEIPDDIYRKYIGGYGLGAYLIYQKHKDKGIIDPLGEDNILGFTSGLLTGTGSMFSGRYMACGKSPLTGTWGDANSGGTLSPAIKRCGVDAIFIEGISDKPVYLYVSSDHAEIRDATRYWGMDALQVEDALIADLGQKKLNVAAIGPAGEKLSLISGIVNDKGRIAARSGLGAVMGSKRLKALVLAGDTKISVADRGRMKSITARYTKAYNKVTPALPTLLNQVRWAGWLLRKLFFQPRTEAILYREILRKYGTCGITAFSAESGDSPVKNWKGSGVVDFPVAKKSHKISDLNVIKYEKRKYGCHSCPLNCGGIVSNPQGKYKIEETHKPEYETICSFGTLMLNDDIEAIMLLSDLCNRAGIDTISTGTTIAWAMECFEEGIITEQDLGFRAPWGDVEAIFKLLDMMVKREGFGNLLADGVMRAAHKVGKGSERFAIHAGGQELPMHDPRYDPGYGIAYVAEPTPGRHTIASIIYAEMMRLERQFKNVKGLTPVFLKSSKYQPKGKGELMSVVSRYNQVGNCAGMCVFAAHTSRLPLIEWINAATGWDMDEEEFMRTGERIETLRHCYNVQQGIAPLDTMMTPRAQGDPPLEMGPLAGVKLDMISMIKEFYSVFDWDFETGKPSVERLRELDLDWLIKAMYPTLTPTKN